VVSSTNFPFRCP